MGLVISLAFAGWYGYLAMEKGFSAAYVIQDDARHYLFWMERFHNGDAFPHDLVADYLQSIAPVGYKLLYRLGSYVNLAPDWLGKVLPMVLGLIAAGYYYGLSVAIFPVPVAGAIASVLLSQHLWCNDDVVSASPRSFIYPLLIPLLFYLVRGQRLKSLLFLGLLVLFYPPVGVVATTLYAADAVDWGALKRQWRTPWTAVHRGRVKFAIAAFTIAALCILPTYVVAHQSFGPVVTMAQARSIPEFQPSGRHSFFRAGLERYWLVIFGGHGAILKRTLFTPATLAGAVLLLPLAGGKMPELRAISPRIHIFTKLTLVGLGWFAAAYAVAFKLHMPGRYTSHCIMLAVPILAAIFWTCLLAYVGRRCRRGVLPIAMVVVLVPIFFYYPLLLKKFPKTLYMTGHEAPIYEYLQRQPPDTLVASLDYEVDNIPSFAKRSVLMAPEYATPFHLGYYRQIRQRANDLLQAHYTDDVETLSNFTDAYDIDFWLVAKGAFAPDYLAQHRYWANNYPDVIPTVVETMGLGPGLLQTNLGRCTAVETQRLWLVNSRCLLAPPISASN